MKPIGGGSVTGSGTAPSPDTDFTHDSYRKEKIVDNDSLVVIIIGGIMSFVLGYVLGREHAHWEMRALLKKKIPTIPH